MARPAPEYGAAAGPDGPAEREPRVELHGPRLTLRTTVETDRQAIVAIQATPEVRRRWRGDDLDAEFTERLDRDDEVEPLTVLDAGGRIVGYLQYAQEDDPDYRHASIDLFVDPANHRLGYATEAITMVVDHLFADLGHHRITIDPAADNEAAIACYAGVGFRPVGVLRDYERQGDGSWADGLLMELLVTDPRPGRPGR
ncbi:MAG: GNAT family protein [Actinomycetota bacterium]